MSEDITIVIAGSRLRAKRENQGHTQESLAQSIGVSGRQIGRWEHSKANPQANQLLALARVLNTSTDYLLGLSDDPTPYGEKNDGLSIQERKVVEALRRGDGMAAIKAIITD